MYRYLIFIATWGSLTNGTLSGIIYKVPTVNPLTTVETIGFGTSWPVVSANHGSSNRPLAFGQPEERNGHV